MAATVLKMPNRSGAKPPREDSRDSTIRTQQYTIHKLQVVLIGIAGIVGGAVAGVAVTSMFTKQ